MSIQIEKSRNYIFTVNTICAGFSKDIFQNKPSELYFPAEIERVIQKTILQGQGARAAQKKATSRGY